MRRAAAAGVVVAVLSVLPAASPADASPAVAAPAVVCRPADSRLTEVSGLAVGIRSPGVLYVHNDSGDSARFFALDARSCAVLGEYTVPGATNVDWEDIAVAPDARGVPSVWLADIGDNRGTRDEVRLYRVDEPDVDRTTRDAEHLTARAETWRLRYPAGARDAESLAVTPAGRAFVVTKDLLGRSDVYEVPPRPAAQVQDLRRVGSVRFTFTATSGGPNPVGRLTATGAAMSRDGSVLAVRTYTDAYLWPVRDGDVAAAVSTEPVRVPLPAQPQGEGIAVDGARLLVDSEGVGEPVESVALPRLPAPRAAPSPSSTATATATAIPAATTSPQRPSTAPPARHRSPAVPLVGTVLGVALVGGLSVGFLTLRRRAGRSGPAS